MTNLNVNYEVKKLNHRVDFLEASMDSLDNNINTFLTEQRTKTKIRRLGEYEDIHIDWSKSVISVIDCWKYHGNPYIDLRLKTLYQTLNAIDKNGKFSEEEKIEHKNNIRTKIYRMATGETGAKKLVKKK